MPKALVFWIIFLIILVLFVFLSWPLGKLSYAILAVFVLIGLLGWAVFGPMIKG